MLDSTILEDTNIVTATYSGSLGADETATLRHQIEQVIDAHGSARLLLEMGDVDMGRVEPKAVWEDLKSAQFLGDVSRMALVTDESVLASTNELMGKLTATETKAFASDDRDQAIVWLQS